MTEMVPFGFGSPIGRERSSGGNQDGHHVCFGPRPVRDPSRSGLSTVDPSPRWLDPAARYLRAELPRPEVGGGGQDAEEAWPQARVHDRGRHSAQAPPAPDQRTARHRLTQATQSDRLGALTAGPTAKLSAWSRWSSGRCGGPDQKQVALALSDRPVWPS